MHWETLLDLAPLIAGAIGLGIWTVRDIARSARRPQPSIDQTG